MTADIRRKRRYWVPEVVQTSAMDCGPAVLKCLLEGFGIQADFGRLREACQTDLDGTSIDVLEQLAGQLGLAAEQVMLPIDHLLLAESESLPGILVVRLPNGFTHFILIWRIHGTWVQIMDPAVGRKWMTCRELLDEIYVHHHRLPALGWHEWARSEENRQPMLRRLRELGIKSGEAHTILDEASIDPDWRRLAVVDAAMRMSATLVQAGGVRRGREARDLLLSLIDEASADSSKAKQVIPDQFWSVLEAPVVSGETGANRVPGKDDEVLFRGAVLVRVLGRKSIAENPSAEEKFGPELTAALAVTSGDGPRRFLGLFSGNSVLSLIWLVIGVVLAAGCVVFEGMLFRGAMGIGRDLGPLEQRLNAVIAFAMFIGLVMFLEYAVASRLFHLGRNVEARLRVAFLEKIPCLIDRYFQSRPISDMSERSHAIHQVRLLPELAGTFLRTVLALAITSGAITWVEPALAPLAWGATAVALAVPLAFNRMLQGIDARFRTHTGALGRFYLDALLGLTAIRLHGAERSLRREHESLLVEWARVNQHFFRCVVFVEGIQIFIGFGLAAGLVLLHASRATDFGATLLLAFWALQLPVLAGEVVRLARQYPMQRNLILRLIEPLGAPVEARDAPAEPGTPGATDSEVSGAALTFDAVTVQAAGHLILQEIDLQIRPGSHVAIVGPSGAGKSSLIGLLLGWHRAAAGQVLIDGQPLNASGLELLRDQTAWVDPAVQLWNRSLLGNLQYGAQTTVPGSLGQVLEDADLYDVLERLPEGLQTPLGEGGGLVSGGEGQRVRFGRALVRRLIRLAILDEPFRGLDRERRRELLRTARQRWQAATLLCVTHDVSETSDFERVLVIDGGRVVEDGPPAQLAAVPGSRYCQLLEAETEVRQGLWSGSMWRRLQLADGRLQGNGVPIR